MFKHEEICLNMQSPKEVGNDCDKSLLHIFFVQRPDVFLIKIVTAHSFISVTVVTSYCFKQATKQALFSLMISFFD